MLVAAAFFEKRLKRKHAVTVTNEGITLQSAFTVTYPWQQLANVIIKEGLVTVDTKSNRIYQKDIDADFTAEYEAEINEFCRLKLQPGT
jgi:hypothetical protein